MVTDIWKLCWYQCSKETSPGRLSSGYRWNVGLRPLGNPSEESTCPSCAWHPRIHPGHSFPIRKICNYLERSMFQSRHWYLFKLQRSENELKITMIPFLTQGQGTNFLVDNLFLTPTRRADVWPLLVLFPILVPYLAGIIHGPPGQRCLAPSVLREKRYLKFMRETPGQHIYLS